MAASIQFNLVGRLNRLFNASSVTFYVRDTQSKAAIQEAIVKTKEGEFKTDQQGYAKADLLSGEQKMTVIAEKYLEKTVKIKLKRGKTTFSWPIPI